MSSAEPTATRTPPWACPQDQTPLQPSSYGWRCSTCDRSYPLEGTVLDLLDEPASVPFAVETQDEIARSESALVDTRAWLAGLMGVEKIYESYSYEEEIKGHLEHLVPLLNPSAVVVDVGCGLGLYGEALLNYVGMYVGIDASMVSLALAEQAFGTHPRVQLGRASAYRLPLGDQSVDAVICAEVIEHVPDPDGLLRELHRVLRPGGVLSLSTPNAYMMLAPYHLLHALRRPRLYLELWTSERNWSRAIEWHPAVRPRVLRQWVRDRGFTVKAHRSRKWYYHTPWAVSYRWWRLVEQISRHLGIRGFTAYLRLTEMLLRLRLFRWVGTRQFIVAVKGPYRDS